MDFLKLFIVGLLFFQFEDSDVGVEDVYNTVEIETSETDMVKDDCMTVSSQPAGIISSRPPSSKSPSATMKNCINNQGILIINPLTSKLNHFP